METIGRTAVKKTTNIVLVAALLVAINGSPALGSSADGFLYGRVTTHSGTAYEGRLRWNEEASWIDHFDANKAKSYREELEKAAGVEGRRPRTRALTVLGLDVRISFGYENSTRLTMVPFGEIQRIEPIGRNGAELTLKSGLRYTLEGGLNDIGSKIRVWDGGIKEIEIPWDRIETIEFLPTPSDLSVDFHRLHGTVESDFREFTGFIQWDLEECLSTDTLDGETVDGTVTIEMGEIRAIERRSRSSARVLLRDGRELVVRGTRDVNSGNRGIFIDDPRFGRVLLTWDDFLRVEFSDLAESGPAYGDFPPATALRGTVRDTDGHELSGRLVFDLDERETWELLNGFEDDIHFHIPFSKIASIKPTGSDKSLVTLRDGTELELEDSVDVNEANRGVLIYLNDNEPSFVAWEKVGRIDFEKGGQARESAD